MSLVDEFGMVYTIDKQIWWTSLLQVKFHLVPVINVGLCFAKS